MDAEQQRRRWVERWRVTAELLAAQRRVELRDLTDREAREAIDDVLALEELAAEHDGESGLVEQQRILHRRNA